MESSKYQYLLDDRDVMRWFMNECRGSEITGRERLRRLGAICERFDTRPNELKKIQDATESLRRKAAIALVAFSGLRLENLGDYFGEDGLKIKDLPEMAIQGGEVQFKRIPTVVTVRDVLNKAGHEYTSFLNEEGCDYLKAYVEDRIRPKTRKRWSNGKGEEYQVPGWQLTPDSPVITPSKRGTQVRTYVQPA